MKHVLSVLVQNQPGVLVRVTSMFSRRGFNIDSLAVGVTHVPEYSRITAVICGNQAVVNQVVKQLEKLVEVVNVQILEASASVSRGMAMLKVTAGERRGEILKLAEIFRASVVDISENTLTLEVTGDEDKINALVELLIPYGMLEMTRTGLIGLARGENTIYQYEERENYEENVL
ncbi:small subunit acetolactate synthase synthase transferase acid biosynthesis iii lyase [Lucifera butyrica]|uniref:Acetolactate synthase small subunit n=1 Tax=Lucifera butyrica TaxID=1351585 RepID=A0A498R2M7_9FIRM|nr:acetolactate synthase small subunit [Lucifera butyrica]VBB06886.1 small subunit acetolactate synthase synthase transferase acid biosynthesis iii lyase [Lucifera butyrica]